MARKIVTNKVVYVEPNALEDFTSYNSNNNGLVNKSVDLEDMCVVVGLEVEVKGRSYDTGAKDTIRMTWQSDISGSENRISFLRGTKIKTKNNGEVHLLTTSYTDTYIKDIEKNGTCEMFGIKSIDINYDNMMVPEVTINFIDVRGVSLFAQEEIRHRKSQGEMNGIIDNDVDGSFFKAFFTFPYPRFILYVKGFYGKMVSYELTCSDFRSAFDSNTGNFNVTARFIGYAFSFLNDVMVTGLYSAPYSEYIGKKYWEDSVNSGRFSVPGINKVPVQMPTLAEICSKYNSIQEDVAKTIEETPASQIAQNVGASEEQVKTLEKYDERLQKIKLSYDGLIEKFQKVEEFVKNGSHKDNDSVGDSVIHTDDSESNSVVFIFGSKPEELKNLIDGTDKSFNELNEMIRDLDPGVSTALDKWKSENTTRKLELKCVDYSDLVDTDSKKIKNKKYIEEQGLIDKIDKKAAETCVGGGNKTYYEVWYDGWFQQASYVYIYQDFKFKSVLPDYDNEKEQKESETLKQNVQKELLKIGFAKEFEFNPTVENITRILMAHVETFIYMINQCADNIISVGTQRSFGNLNVNVECFTDSGGNNPTGINDDTIVAPFPKVTKRETSKDEPSTTRWEGAWIGEIDGATRDKFEEIQLVEGILNGVEEAQKASTETNSQALFGEAGERKILMYPLTYFDLFLTDNDSVFGNNINFRDVNDIFARFCVRAFTIFSTQGNKAGLSDVIGAADAENFLERFGGNSDLSVLADYIQNLTSDQVYSFVLNGSKIDTSKKTNPWGTKDLLEVTDNFGSIGLVCGNYDGNPTDNGVVKYRKRNVLPIRNWDFKELSIFTAKNGGLASRNFKKSYVTTTYTGSNDFDTTFGIKSLETPVTYLKNIYNIIASSKYEKAVTFDEEDFEFNGWGGKYDRGDGPGVVFFKKDGTHSKIEDAVYYDDSGKASIRFDGDDEYAIDLCNLSLSEDFWAKPQKERAIEFILEVFGDSKRSYDDFGKTQPQLKYLPKFRILADGAYLIKNGHEGKVRDTIYNFYINYFNKWYNNGEGEYTDIEKYFELEFNQENTINTLNDKLKDNKLSDSLDTIKERIASCLTQKGIIIFNQRYDIVGGVYESDTRAIYVSYSNVVGNVYLRTRPTKDLKNLVEGLFNVVAVCTTTKFNQTNEEYLKRQTPWVSPTNLKSYFEGVISVLKEKIKKDETGQVQVEVSLNTDPDDIKVGVYNYIKLLYDKWLACNNQKDFYTVERMFNGIDGNGPIFHFVDSFYTKIGQTLYLNLSGLVGRLNESKTNSGYTLLSLMSQLYADNKFLLLCVQNFLDFSQEGCMDSMFKPIPYIGMGPYPDNMPNFIILQPYEASSKLDVEGADYRDDGFYLDDENEANLPPPIREKGEEGMPIPAFGVCYGQQYQNYFTNIQVDMNNPMVTEQSIKAKFLICGADTETGNQGTQEITAGQDLYTIYANNSYTCTVTMMGCAWVQPMMYFVLKNVPMFRGSYMIVKVNHQIQPGLMTTTFKGVRMANSATRAVSGPIFGDTSNSLTSNDYGYNEASTYQPSANADISNDCPYSYSDPLQREVKVPSNADKQAYCYAVYQILTKSGSWCAVNGNSVDYPGLTPAQAKGICANMLEESGFDPYVLTIDGNRNGHSAGGGLCGFYTKNGAEGYRLFEWLYGESVAQQKIAEINAKLEPIWASNPKPCSSSNNKKIREMGLKFPISFEDQMKYICHCIQTRFTGIKNCSTESESAWYWIEKYERPAVKVNRWTKEYGKTTNGGWVNSAIEAGMKIDMKKSEEEEVPSATTDSVVAEGLRKSVENSLKTSNNYKNVEVTMKSAGNSFYIYKASGNKANSAMFDCLLNTYNTWFERISWDVGKQSPNSEATSVTLKVVTKKPDHILIEVTAVDVNGKKRVQISERNDLNENFRMSLEKYFKSKNFKTGAGIKSICRSIVAEDSEVEEWFGISVKSDSVKECDSCFGNNNDDGYKMTGGRFAQNNDPYNIEAACNYCLDHSAASSLSACAKYVRSAIDVGFGTNPNNSTSYTGKAGRPTWAWQYIDFLPKIGFELVQTVSKANGYTYSGQTGDIAVYQKGNNPNVPGHICMLCGNMWVSDFRQNSVMIYHGQNAPSNVYYFRFKKIT